MINTPCIIFAGGKSSRMGEDKALLPFDGFSTLAEYQLSKLSKIFTNVYISCDTKKKFQFSANFIEDTNSSNISAPTFGFLAIFETLQVEKFFVLSVDAPFVDEETIKQLINQDTPLHDATIAQTQKGLQPLCGVYHRSLEKKFLEMKATNRHKLNFLLKNANTNALHFDNENIFMNLNNPKEYQQALKLLHY